MGGWEIKARGIKHTAMDGEPTLGDEHTMGSTDDVIQNCTPEIVILLKIVTPIN